MTTPIAATTSAQRAVPPRARPTPIHDIDENVCALTDEEKKQLIGGRNINVRRELIERGALRAQVISDFNSHFEVPLEAIFDVLDKDLQEGASFVERLRLEKPGSFRDLILACPSKAEIKEVALATACAGVDEYVGTSCYRLPDGSNHYFTYRYPIDGQVHSLYIFSRDVDFKKTIAQAKEVIDAARVIDERLVKRVQPSPEDYCI